MSSEVIKQISSTQADLYPATSRTHSFWTRGDYNMLSKQPLTVRAILLPMACYDAFLEVVKRVSVTVAEVFTGMATILQSVYSPSQTVKMGLKHVEKGIASLAKLLTIPPKFIWQIICVLKEGVDVTPMNSSY